MTELDQMVEQARQVYNRLQLLQLKFETSVDPYRDQALRTDVLVSFSHAFDLAYDLNRYWCKLAEVVHRSLEGQFDPVGQSQVEEAYYMPEGSMKSYNLIIFDTDGTLVETASSEKFRKQADDWKWLPGRLEKLHALKAQGVKLAIATNQGGVAFGYMQQVDILRELTRMCVEGHIPMSGLYICYNHPAATNEAYRHVDYRRKPGAGMILDATGDFDVAIEDTLVVGDRPEDEEAAKNAGCDFMWASEFFA